MQFKIVLAGLCLTLFPHAGLRAQGLPTGNVGWYNGDWKQFIPGIANWYVSDQMFARSYDDFVVPAGGWTVTSVFSNNSLYAEPPAEAVWEIRSGVTAGNGGKLVAFGRSPATYTVGANVGGGAYNYRVQVDGLRVQLAAGTYWLSVTPVMEDGQSYLCATVGAGAVGTPAGNDGKAYLNSPVIPAVFRLMQTMGQGGTSGDYSLGVLISGPATTEPSIMTIVNAASFQGGPVSPGEIVTIAGSGMGPSTPATLTLDASGNVANSLAGVQVQFDGVAAPLIYVSSTQINAVVPYQAAGLRNLAAQVSFGGQQSNALPLLTDASAPALFTYDGSGKGQAAILNQDNSYNTPANPAAKGSFVVMYVTGEGQTNPAGVTGRVTTPASASPLTPQPVQPVSVLIGGRIATVAFYGEAPEMVSGVMQLNVQIPAASASGNLPVFVSVGGKSSPSGVTIAVR